MVKKEVSIVILPINDYTGNVADSKELRIYIPGENVPIKKAEGYHVFVDVSKREFNIFLEGKTFRRRILPINLDEFNNESLVEIVHLTPSREYGFVAGTSYISGTGEPGSTVYIKCNSSLCDPYKLSVNYKGEEPEEEELSKEGTETEHEPAEEEMEHGPAEEEQHGEEEEVTEPDEVTIFTENNEDLAGKRFVITDYENSDVFIALNKVEDKENTYKIDKPLKYSYNKDDAEIYPVLDTYTDEDGAFFMPLRFKVGDECICEIGTDLESEFKELEVKPGEDNKIDLT